MVEQRTLTRGGIYLAKPDPAKAAKACKIRPIIILNAQTLLDVEPPTIFICPLSSHSQPAYASLHIEILSRDNLKSKSYALIDHCRSISIRRILHPRLAQLTNAELSLILHKLQRLVGVF